MFLGLKTELDWIRQVNNAGAIWSYQKKKSGEKARPHVEITSAHHTNVYFNSGVVMADSFFASDICETLVDQLAQTTDLEEVDVVVGPAMGAVTLAYGIAYHIGKKRGRLCHSTFAEKVEPTTSYNKTFQVVGLPSGRFARDQKVLLCEDTISTGGTVSAVRRSVEMNRCRVLPVVLAILNRSGLTKIDGLNVVSIMNRSLLFWPIRDCPMCREGSTSLRPKNPKNWAILKDTG
jgi:orotate phosphoribosyltransferase